MSDWDEEFETFVVLEQPRLLRLGYALTGSQHDARDLAQDTLVAVGLNWRKVKRSSAASAYARTTLVRLNIRRWRRGRHEVLVEPPDAAAAGADDSVPGLSRELTAALNSLGSRQRTTIVLRHIYDLSLIQIAAEMSSRSAPSRVSCRAPSRAYERSSATHRANRRRPQRQRGEEIAMSDGRLSDPLTEALSQADWTVAPSAHTRQEIEAALHDAHSKRRNALAGSVVALTLVVLIAGTIYRHVADEGALLPQTGTVDLPPRNAGPRQVVVSYIQALDVHDATTAYALSGPPSSQMHGATTYYLQQLDRVTSFRITSVVPGDGSRSDGPEVELTWDLDWHRPDYLEQNGSQVWGFILKRDSRTGRWLISDQGTG